MLGPGNTGNKCFCASVYLTFNFQISTLLSLYQWNTSWGQTHFIPSQRQCVCFYLFHSYLAQLHIMAFHSSPPPHCTYQGVSSSWSLSTSSTFNGNIWKKPCDFKNVQECKFCWCRLVFHFPDFQQVQHVDKGHGVIGKALSLTFAVASYWHSGRRDIQTVKVKRKETLINSKVMHRNSKLCSSLFRLQFVLFVFNFRFNVNARF